MSEPQVTIRQLSADEYLTVLGQIERELEPPVTFLQSPLYGRLQERDRKTVVYFAAYSGENVLACGLAVRYTAPFGMNFLYCPYGPVVSEWSSQLARAIHVFFKPIARELGCTFVRLDSDSLADPLGNPIPNRLARTASLQPRAEWLLDITATEDDLWMGFHKHARYNVRLAERVNAETKTFKPHEAPLDDFFMLMQTTASRDSFGIFDRSYYAAYLAAMKPEDGFMTICYIDGKPAATGLFVTHDQQAHYVFAGSSDENRKIAPAYSVIWSAIQTSKKAGCTLFNFGGIMENVKGQDLGGVTGFKRRFGGYSMAHQNPVDLVYGKARYIVFKLYKTFSR